MRKRKKKIRKRKHKKTKEGDKKKLKKRKNCMTENPGELCRPRLSINSSNITASAPYI